MEKQRGKQVSNGIRHRHPILSQMLFPKLIYRIRNGFSCYCSVCISTKQYCWMIENSNKHERLLIHAEHQPLSDLLQRRNSEPHRRVFSARMYITLVVYNCFFFFFQIYVHSIQHPFNLLILMYTRFEYIMCFNYK